MGGPLAAGQARLFSVPENQQQPVPRIRNRAAHVIPFSQFRRSCKRKKKWLASRCRPHGSVCVADTSVRDSFHLLQVLQSDIDLLHPPAELEKRSHKLKRLVQSPNSFFMDVKCQGCFQMYALSNINFSSSPFLHLSCAFSL